MEKKEPMYYIQNGYVGNAILWWAKESRGYTTEIEKAGKYTKSQAKEIIKRPCDRAWLCSHIDKNTKARKLIIDVQYLNHRHCMKGQRR